MKKYAVMIVAAAVLIAGAPKIFALIWGNSFPDRGMKEFTLTLTENGEIITISAEEYLTGCLFAQIDVSYEEEALKAQASAAYTYALRLSGEGRELSDSSALCQPYFTPAKAKEYYGKSYEVFIMKTSQYTAFTVRFRRELQLIRTIYGICRFHIWHGRNAQRIWNTCILERRTK